MAGTVRAGSAGPGAEQNSGSEGGERELGVLVLFFLTGEDPWSLTSFPGLLVCVLDARNGTHTDQARSRGKAEIVMALPQRARGVKIWEWGGSIRAREVVTGRLPLSCWPRAATMAERAACCRCRPAAAAASKSKSASHMVWRRVTCVHALLPASSPCACRYRTCRLCRSLIQLTPIGGSHSNNHALVVYAQ